MASGGPHSHREDPVVLPSCGTCGRSFADLESLWRHVRGLVSRVADRHAGHRCPWPRCGRVFVDRGARARHAAHHPDGPEAAAAAAYRPAAAVYSCELCGMTARSAAEHEGHVARWHPAAAFATCRCCRTYQGDSAGLQRHALTEHRPRRRHAGAGRDDDDAPSTVRRRRACPYVWTVAAATAAARR